MKRRSRKPHGHAIRPGAYAVGAAEEPREVRVGEIVALRPRYRADARGRIEIESIELDLVARARARLAQRQPVAGHERASLPAAEASAQVGRVAAEHGF